MRGSTKRPTFSSCGGLRQDQIGADKGAQGHTTGHQLHSSAVMKCSCCLTRQQRGEEGRKVLQGAVSVVEDEAKVSRQELLSVLEAEIRTRSAGLKVHIKIP